jgi:hypothetical protein
MLLFLVICCQIVFGERIERFETTRFYPDALSVVGVPRADYHNPHGTNYLRQPFSFTIQCNGEPKICTGISRNLPYVGAQIGRLLRISEPITVLVTYRNFQSGSSVERQHLNSPAETVIGAYYSARKPDQSTYYLYPQALVKQLNTDIPLSSFVEHDMTIHFNDDFTFWFPGGNPINDKELDFRIILAHHLAHGLGLVSAWSTFPDTKESIVTPGLTFRQHSGMKYLAWYPDDIQVSSLSHVNTATVEGWLPIGVFDQYVYDAELNVPIIDYLKEITAFDARRMPYSKFWNTFKESGKPYVAAKSLYALFTSNKSKAIKIDLEGNISAYLHTSNNKFRQSCIAHFARSAEQIEDGVMSYGHLPLLGKTLEELLPPPPPNQHHSPIYGNRTILTLSLLGYPTIFDNERGSIELGVSKDPEIPVSQKSSSATFTPISWSWTLFFLILLQYL